MDSRRAIRDVYTALGDQDEVTAEDLEPHVEYASDTVRNALTDLLDARLEQATDRLAAYLDTQGATTVAVEAAGGPDRTLAELARDGANADARLKPRLREHVHGLASEGYRVVDVFPGGTSTACHACETGGRS